MNIIQSIQSRTCEIRGKKVILDFDLALIYGMKTRDLNQCAKHFAEDCMFQLSKKEAKSLVSRNVIADIQDLGVACDCKYQPQVLPFAFTEDGVDKLARALGRDKVDLYNRNMLSDIIKEMEPVIDLTSFFLIPGRQTLEYYENGVKKQHTFYKSLFANTERRFQVILDRELKKRNLQNTPEEVDHALQHIPMYIDSLKQKYINTTDDTKDMDHRLLLLANRFKKWLNEKIIKPEPEQDKEAVAPQSQPEPGQVGIKEMKNNFDNTEIGKIYDHFHKGLVDKHYLDDVHLISYLRQAFELKLPDRKISLTNRPTKTKIYKVFNEYYKDIAGKPHGRQKEYAALLGDYFEGFDTKNVSSNFTK